MMPLDQSQPNINYLPDADDQPLLIDVCLVSKY